MTEVGKISVSIEGDASKLESAAQRASGAVRTMVDQIASAARSIGGTFQTMGGSVLGGAALMVGTFAAAYAAVQAFGLIVNTVLPAVSSAFGASMKDAMAWEDAFAGVKKVLGETANSGATKKLEDDLIALSTRIPVAATELAKFAQIGAQMGIQQADLARYAELIARISTSFDGATAEQMALSLGKMQGQLQMNQNELERFASAIMLVGAHTRATEQQIIQVSEKFAGMAHIIGLTNSQVVGYAATAASLNNRYAESGTAIFRMMQTFKQAVDDGGKKAQVFAKLLDLPVEEFRKLAKERPDEVFQKVTLSLGGTEGKAVNTTRVLRELGFTGRTTGGIFLAMANDAKQLEKSLKESAEEVARGNAIVEMSNIRWDTAVQHLKTLGNAATATSIEFGRTFLPALNEILKALEPMGVAAYNVGAAFRIAFQKDLVDSIKPATGFIKEVSDGVVVASLALRAMAAEHQKKNEVEQFWNALGTGIKYAGQAAVANIPVLREALTAALALRDAGKNNPLPFEMPAGPPESRDIGLNKTPAEVEAEKQAAAALLKMQESLRDQLEKLRNSHQSAYQSMIADIDVATQKRLLEARIVAKDNVDALKSMTAQVYALRTAEIEAGKVKLFDSAFGPADAGVEKFLKLADGLRAVGGASALSSEQLKSSIPLIEDWAHVTQSQLFELEAKGGAGTIKFLDDLSDRLKKYRNEVIPILKFDLTKMFPAKNGSAAGLVPFTTGQTQPGFGSGVNPNDIQKEIEARKAAIALQLEQEAKQKLVNEALKSYYETAFKNGKISREEYERVNVLLDTTKDKTFGLVKAVQLLSDGFKAFGISADSALGRMIATGTIMAAVFDIGYKRMKSNQQLTAGDKAELAGAGIGTLASIYAQSREDPSTGHRVGMGALQGAGTGAAIGAAVGLPAGGVGAIPGAAIGGVIGGLAGGVTAYFAGPAWKGAMEQAGQTFGFTVSKEMAKAIKSDMDKLHIDAASASLLHIGDAVNESGKSTTSFIGQISELFNAINAGTVPAKQGIAQLGTLFGTMQQEAAAAGREVDAGLIGMIQMARKSGVEFAGMKAYVEAALGSALEFSKVAFGVKGDDGKVKGGLAIKDRPNTAFNVDTRISGGNMEQQAKDQGLLFSTLFWATVKEKGIGEAVDSMGPQFDVLKERITAALGPEAAAQILGPMGKAFEMFKEGPARDALMALDALRQMTVGIAQAGYMDKEVFEAFQRQAVVAFQDMTAGGDVSKESLLAMAPAIQQAIQMSEQFGIPLSEDVQKLKDLAEQNGITFKTDPMQEMVDILRAIAEALGAIVPAAGAAGTALGNMPKPPGPGGNNPNGGFTVPDPNTHAALGYYNPSLPVDTTIRAHTGEAVSIVPANSNSGLGAHGGGGNVTVNFNPVIELTDNSLIKTREGVEAFRDVLIPELHRALRLNVDGVVSRIKQGLK